MLITSHHTVDNTTKPMSSSSNPDVPSSSVLTVDDGNGCGESVGVGVGVGGTDRPSVPTINGASKSASKSASRLSVSGVDVVVDVPHDTTVPHHCYD